MKRIIAAVMCAVMMLALVPQVMAREYGGYRAVVANPVASDRLNLRVKPDANSKSLGRFYSGTPVQVLDDGIREGWALVSVGDLAGYMQTAFLMRENRNYEAPKLLCTARLRNRQAELRSEPSQQAESLGTVSGTVYVLGDVGDDWRYVQETKGNHCGYVRTAELTDKRFHVDTAFLMPANGEERVTVYEDAELKKEIAVYYSGAAVEVLDWSRAGWAKVRCRGTLQPSESVEYLDGYVRLEDLTVFKQAWEIESKARVGVAVSEILLSEANIPVPAGAALAVAGETKEQYHIVYGNPLEDGTYLAAFVDKDLISLTDTQADRLMPPAIGYAFLTIPVDEDGWLEGVPVKTALNGDHDHNTEQALCELIAQGDGWVQVRQGWEPNFFVDSENVKTVTSVLHEQEISKGPGVWTVEEGEQGLWLFRVEKGKEAALYLSFGDGDYLESYAAAPMDADETYTVYLSAGERVEMTGDGTLTAVTEGNYPVIVPLHPADTYEDQMIFTGSGRFFCDLQLPDYRNWFSYIVRPMPGSEDSWMAVSDLFQGEADYDPYYRIELREDDDEYEYESAWYLDLEAGQFVELHNCILEICYGNG